MHKSFKLENKQSVLSLVNDKQYQEGRWGEYDFWTYGSGHPQLSILSHDGYNIREEDSEFKIMRHAAPNRNMLQTDVSAYEALSAEELEQLIREEKEHLEEHYNALLKQADDVQMELLYLMMLMRLRKYFDIKPVEHTSNQWIRNEVYPGEPGREYNCTRSNMVYRMYYRVSHYDYGGTRPYSLYWSVDVWNPSEDRNSTIGVQDKSFKTEEEMLKYLNGRIKAYDKYFKEISPAVPERFLQNFTFGGKLLPGYHAEES